MYTKAQIESKRKDQVVDIALQLVAQVESLSTPVSSDVIKAEMLSLKRQAVDVASKRKTDKEAHIESLKQIEANAQKEIAVAELKYSSEDGVDAKALDEQYAKLEANASKAVKDLTFGLEQAEQESKVKLDEITVRVETAQAKHDESIEKFSQEIAEKKSSVQESIATMSTNHTRKIEQTTYDNKIALRDNNAEYAAKAADDLGMSLVDTVKYQALINTEQEDEKAAIAKFDAAVDAAKSKTYASEGAKYSKLKNDTDSEIALLKNDNTHLNTNVAAGQARIKDLESKLALVPSQIKEAVAASQAAINVNQDAGKK